MAKKFKVGDKVVAIKNLDGTGHPFFKKGQRGEVVGFNGDLVNVKLTENPSFYIYTAKSNLKKV